MKADDPASFQWRLAFRVQRVIAGVERMPG